MKSVLQRELSTEIRGRFLKSEYPVPFGLLDNRFIDEMPCSHKNILADAFYRSWSHYLHKKTDCSLFFISYERGPYYKKHHYQTFVDKVMMKFVALGYIRKDGKTNDKYFVDIDKFLNNRNM